MPRAFFLLHILLIFCAFPAQAAPYFCIAKGGGDSKCSFYNVAACQDYARGIGANCVLRNGGGVPSVGTSEICAIYDNVRIECIYKDIGECRRNMRNNGAICIEKDDS